MVPPSEDSEPELPQRSEPSRFGPPTSLEALVASVGDLPAAELINGGVPELLVRGELDFLRRELCTPTAERLAQLRDGGIAPALLRTSAVLAYSEPDAAGALLDLLPWGYEAPAWLYERAAVAPHLASQLQGDLPEPLRRLVVLAPVLSDGPWVIPLLEDALALCRRHPEQLGPWLDPLPPELVDEVGRALAVELTLLAHSEEPEPVLARSELGQRLLRTALPALGALLSGVERAMEQDRGNRLWTVGMLVTTVLGGVAGWLFGWPGALFGVVSFVLVGALPALRVDARLYAAHMRVPLIRYVLQTGASPAQLRGELDRRPFTSSARRFTSDVVEDPALLFASRLAAALRERKAGAAWPEPAV